jgi:hypothetical protein
MAATTKEMLTMDKNIKGSRNYLIAQALHLATTYLDSLPEGERPDVDRDAMMELLFDAPYGIFAKEVTISPPSAKPATKNDLHKMLYEAAVEANRKADRSHERDQRAENARR